MNWKIIAGVLIIFGALKELSSIISNYRSGKLEFWPFGADIACIALIIAGIVLIRKGLKQKNNLRQR